MNLTEFSKMLSRVLDGKPNPNELIKPADLPPLPISEAESIEEVLERIRQRMREAGIQDVAFEYIEKLGMEPLETRVAIISGLLQTFCPKCGSFNHGSSECYDRKS